MPSNLCSFPIPTSLPHPFSGTSLISPDSALWELQRKFLLQHRQEEFYFLSLKSKGEVRSILNLPSLNKLMKYEILHGNPGYNPSLRWITITWYIALNLQAAYFHVAIFPVHRKFEICTGRSSSSIQCSL